MVPPVDDRIPEVTASRFIIDTGRPIVGLDIGEDFLDLAMLEKGWKSLRYARVALTAIESSPIDAIAARLKAIAPPITADTFAIVDSPRWPRDLCLENPSPRPIRIASSGRAIDRAIREIVAPLVGRLSMYPTPELDSFLSAVADPRCKPHLRTISSGLWDGAGPTRYEQLK